VKIRIALTGKPNSGKSSLFNQLTGLNQKIGNFPGVTVDKHSGSSHLATGVEAEILDLPGTYSLYPRSLDEKIVAEILTNPASPHYPDKVVLIADATNLRNCLLLLTQLIDLRIPSVLALNMVDMAARAGQSIDVNQLSALLHVPVVMINAREGTGLEELKKVLAAPLQPSPLTVYAPDEEIKAPVEEIRTHFGLTHSYTAYQLLQQGEHLRALSAADRDFLSGVWKKHQFFRSKYQGVETLKRFEFIQDLLQKVILSGPVAGWDQANRTLDKVLVHPLWGYLIFLSILFLIFQSIFAWATVPMDFIDQQFANLAHYLTGLLPSGAITELLTKGLVPGIGGIVIFIPQIAILFAFLAILEETGYMARVVFLMDRIMRTFGLNGRSIVPLMSGVACAIPAIMATRTIDNWKERLITILVTPFMSCSARLPVYTIIVALVVPDQKVWGFFNLQGLALMGMYLLGFAAAIGAAMVLSLIIRIQSRGYLMMELPTYRLPKWSNVAYTLVEKTKTFVFEAGKVIIAVSVILWVLASYGPVSRRAIEAEALKNLDLKSVTGQELEDHVAAYRLEHSYAGIIGKSIEPAIKPLGYDWKIGVALITSFAAREVFVSTMATIYSMGSIKDQATIKDRMREEINPATGQPRFDLALGFSLMIFYAFAMQCMSTLAVVYRETKSWKWPAVQLVLMTGLAYISALIVYQVLS
jgi:ferrous iron transport protein B